MRISVIIPCYNSASFLAETIRSAIAQTQTVEEIIVVDDGSTDDSALIAQSFGQNIRVIRQPNLGESGARNTGISAANGDYLLFLDSDDLLHPSSVEVLSQALVHTKDGVALMGGAWFDSDPSQPFQTRLPQLDSFFPTLIHENIGLVHSWLVPQEVVQRAGLFRLGMRFFADWEFWCRVAFTGVSLHPVRFPGAYYRRHDGSVFATSTSRKKEVARCHARVVETLCEGCLSQPRLLQAHGVDLFWSTWAALHRARQQGLTWQELGALPAHFREIARCRPGALGRSHFARMVGLTGVRFAEAVRNLLLPGLAP